MKYLSLLLLFIPYTGFCQILNAEKEWFKVEGFFIDSIVKQHQIKSIEFKIFNKKDGDYIKSSTEKLYFTFNRQGQQLYGKHILKSVYKNDTIEVLYQYNHKNLCISKIDEFGFFRFKYDYSYDNDNKKIKEIKLDALDKKYDTLYIRYYKHYNATHKRHILTFNSSNKAFLKESFVWEKNVLTHSLNYLMNRNFNETKYFYLNGVLVQKEYLSSFKKNKVIRVEFKYKQGKLDEISSFENGDLYQKRGIIYNEKTLPKNIIEREYRNKSVRIYEISYTYY